MSIRRLILATCTLMCIAAITVDAGERKAPRGKKKKKGDTES